MSTTSTLPSGAKLWVRFLDIDAASVLAGANQFPASLPPQQHERRELIMIAALLYHPDIGLMLFDTGSCEDVIDSWGAKSLECCPRIWSKSHHGLPEAIKATGAGDISDIKAIVLSHLHQDHAGGLEHFFDTDVEIWCHEEELKNAFWTCATGIEQGTYVRDYLVLGRLNWKTFSGQSVEIYQGITLHHCPGHTAGSVAMELDLEYTGPIVFTGDAFHVKENYEQGVHPGTLTRDFKEWHRSRDYIRRLVQKRKAKVVLGHEPLYFDAMKTSPEYLE
ncbi:hypothetical protein TruAng_003322 [Truncatella angustata]|nr:hypothetical protein TruAng_003322 [Truncatella angustata]